MTSTISISGHEVTLSEAGDRQTVAIGGLPPISLEDFLRMAEFAVTGSDLKGSEGDPVDPRYKFRAVMQNLHRAEGSSFGAMRFKTPHYLTMFGSMSAAPMPRQG